MDFIFTTIVTNFERECKLKCSLEYFESVMIVVITTFIVIVIFIIIAMIKVEANIARKYSHNLPNHLLINLQPDLIIAIIFN